MSKILYHQPTNQIVTYPRNDNEPIIGLSSDYLVLDQVATEPPEYDEETQIITTNWVKDVDNLQYRQEWVVSDKPEPELVPNWDGFNAYMLTDIMFKSYRDTVRTLDGDLNSALFDSYSIIQTNGTSAFSLVWNVWKQVSGITIEDKNTLANTAQYYNLPTDFVNTLSS